MIHSTAIIDPSAKIGENVTIGPYSVVGPQVTIGDNCELASHVVIQGPTTIGSYNRFYPFASIGSDTQDKKYQNEHTELKIGDHNVFRECCTINRGSIQGGGLTQIGNHNWIMAYVHIAHDCIVGNYVTFSNNATLAGHVTVEDYANLSGFSGAHQFCKIGAYSILGKGTLVSKDVMPFVMVSGADPSTFGINTIGLKRRGFSEDTVETLKRAYKVIYRQGHTVAEAIEKLSTYQDKYPEVKLMIQFLQKSERGIVR